MGVPQKLEDEGFTENDIPRLCELTRTTPSLGLLLSVAPVPATPERIEKIYRRSLNEDGCVSSRRKTEESLTG